MYILLELGLFIRSLYFGDNIHVEILYSEVQRCIWSVIAYVRDEEWINIQFPLSNVNIAYIFCFELLNDSASRVSGSLVPPLSVQ